LHCGGGVAGYGEEFFWAGFFAPGLVVFADADFIAAYFYGFVDGGGSGVAAVDIEFCWRQVVESFEVGLKRDGGAAICEFEVDGEIFDACVRSFGVAFFADGLLEFVEPEFGGVFGGCGLRRRL
jgi:hypothetical protein